MNSDNQLSPWQRKQAALLSLFASVEYLKGLKKLVDDLISSVEFDLRLAADEKRDIAIRSSQWGDRNTAENWENNAWPFLADFQLAIVKDLSNRAFEIFNISGANQCGRGMAEFSMQWSNPAEQEKFDELFASLSLYARNIDLTMDKTGSTSKWNEFNFTIACKRNDFHFHQLPMFKLRKDIVCESGRVPVRTGVYVCLDDPNAALQFAWTGGNGGPLQEASTLNELGLAALARVGRRDLWVNGEAMSKFVSENQQSPLLQSDAFFDESHTPELAPTLVARNAFTSKKARWTFVEILNEQFESIEDDVDEGLDSQPAQRFEAHTLCTKDGFYFSPAKSDCRRHFNVGEIFPEFGSDYGATIWQLDQKQR